MTDDGIAPNAFVIQPKGKGSQELPMFEVNCRERKWARIVAGLGMVQVRNKGSFDDYRYMSEMFVVEKQESDHACSDFLAGGSALR